MAAVTQPTVRQPGQPSAASTMAMYAKGSAKTVCSNLMASSRWRARLTRGASEAVVVPAARDEVAHLVGHADLVGPRLGDVVQRTLLGGVPAGLAAVAMAEGRRAGIVLRPPKGAQAAPGVGVAVRG